MYYSAGNYEAFAHPQKPEGMEHKQAYIVGTGLAALTAAFHALIKETSGTEVEQMLKVFGVLPRK